nr:basic proline-rich protein-like isoform X2 [Anas platyrhynchos]
MEPPGAAAGLAPKRRGPGPAPPRMAEPRPLFDDTSGGAAPPPPRPGPGLRGPPGGPPGVLRIPPAPPRRRLPGRARVQPGRRLRQQLGQPGPGHRGPERHRSYSCYAEKKTETAESREAPVRVRLDRILTLALGA